MDKALLLTPRPNKLIQSYTEAGTYTWTVPDRNGDGSDYEICVIVVGGGGSGSARKYWYTTASYTHLTGGGSGFSKQFKLTVTPNATYNIVVGAGGISVTVGSGTPDGISAGNNGNSSSFNGIVANGGDGGGQYGGNYYIPGSKGGRPSDSTFILPTLSYIENLRPPCGDYISPIMYSSDVVYFTQFAPSDCINAITGDILLSAGGGFVGSTGTMVGGIAQTTQQIIGDKTIGIARWAFQTAENAIAINPTLPGAGGGVCANFGTTNNTTYTATSGKGADGCILIYV